MATRGSLLRLCLCAWLALGACVAPSAVQPQTQLRLAGVKKIALVPARASVMEISIPGSQSLANQVGAARASLEYAAKREVRARGFELVPLPVDETTYRSDPELAFRLTLVQAAADSALERALHGSSKSEDTLSGTRTVLAETDQLARLVDADALLFLRFVAWEKSTGEIAKDAAASAVLLFATMGTFTTMAQTSGAVAAACLIDARTGEVLYAGRADTSEGPLVSRDPYELTVRALDQLAR